MLIVAVVAVVFLCGGAWSVYSGIRLLCQVKNASSSGEYRETEGVVTGFKEEEVHDGETGGTSVSYYPIIEYYVNGSRYTFTGKVGTPSRRSLGRRCTMLYSIYDPSDAVKKGDKTPCIMIGAGAAFIIIALVLLLTKLNGN